MSQKIPFPTKRIKSDHKCKIRLKIPIPATGLYGIIHDLLLERVNAFFHSCSIFPKEILEDKLNACL